MKFAPEMTIGGPLVPGDLIRVLKEQVSHFGIVVIPRLNPGELRVATFPPAPRMSPHFNNLRDVSSMLNLGQNFRLSVDNLSANRRVPEVRGPYVAIFGEQTGIFVSSFDDMDGTQVEFIDFKDWTVKYSTVGAPDLVEYFGWSVWIEEMAGGLGRNAPLLSITLP